MVARKNAEAEVAPTVPLPSVTNIVKPGFNWRSLYLYMVSLITLLIALFSIVSMLRSGVILAYPDPGYLDPNATKVASDLAHASQLAQSRHSSVLGIVDGIAGFIVSAPLYLYHWKLARKSE